MVQLTRVWPGGVSLALISLSVLGCSDESNPTRDIQLGKLALEGAEDASANDAGSEDASADDAGSEGPDAAVSCDTRDLTCDSIDDDCDGRFDEDFPWRCIFGGVAVRCVNGQVEGELCNDSDACTTDSCSAGVCTRTPVTCNDNNPCTVDSCSAGSCQAAPATGASCDDDDPCTTGDACDATGSCSGGALVEVDDGDPCTADSCDAETGVMHTPAAGASCDDGDLCTDVDVCSADGSCLGAPRADIADSDPCTSDLCDPATGAVMHEFMAPGMNCSDGDACNGDETCELLPPQTYDVESSGSFYRVDNVDAASSPNIVSLASAGVAAGQRVRLHVEGTYSSPMASRALVLFSSDATFLPKTDLIRVPGALPTDAPAYVSGLTYFDHQTTEIPEDFQVTASSLEVEIPAGAQYMFLGNYDSYYADNSGTVRLIVEPVAVVCMPGTPPVLDDENACTADACDPNEGVTHALVANGTTCMAVSEPGACLEGACLACSSHPEACQ